MANNQLGSLPLEFGYLTGLEKLHLQKNRIKELPEVRESTPAEKQNQGTPRGKRRYRIQMKGVNFLGRGWRDRKSLKSDVPCSKISGSSTETPHTVEILRNVNEHDKKNDVRR